MKDPTLGSHDAIYEDCGLKNSHDTVLRADTIPGMLWMLLVLIGLIAGAVWFIYRDVRDQHDIAKARHQADADERDRHHGIDPITKSYIPDLERAKERERLLADIQRSSKTIHKTGER
jgi:hypothetical protein